MIYLNCIKEWALGMSRILSIINESQTCEDAVWDLRERNGSVDRSVVAMWWVFRECGDVAVSVLDGVGSVRKVSSD